MGERKAYTDKVIGENTRGTIISEMGRHGVSTKVATSTDMIWRRMSKK